MENTEIELDIDELKKEAKDLGLSHNANIGAEKLKSKIDAYYESQETSGEEIAKAVEEVEKAEATNEKSEEKSVKTGKGGKKTRAEIIKEKKAKASKTRVVTIIDNDQRVNNQTTSCKVNCSNEYFDLGTMVLPLNTPVEVKQGHLNVLKELKIPQHVKDTKTGLSTVRMINRYIVSYEDVDNK